MPKGSSISNSMIYNTPNENPICELSDLNCSQGLGVTRITKHFIKSEEPFEAIRDIIRRRKNIVYKDVSSFSLDEIDACIITNYMDMAIRVSRETAGERREERKSSGKRAFEKSDEVVKGVRRIRE